MDYGAKPVSAKVDDLSWMNGRWLGSYKGERVEEQWSGPDAASIMGMFRWIRDEKVHFFELLTIEEEHGGLAMHIKHFHPGLRGWEEKDESLTLDLVQLQANKAVWLIRGGKAAMWLIYSRSGETMEAWFEKVDGSSEMDARFTYILRA